MEYIVLVSPHHTFGGPLGTRYGATEIDGRQPVHSWIQPFFFLLFPLNALYFFSSMAIESHIGYEVRQITKENGVHLLKLPSCSIHLLQPLDIGVSIN